MAYSFLGDSMHLYKTIKSFLFDQEYFIDMYQKYIHVYSFVDIVTLEEEKIILQMPTFLLTMEGKEFRILKLTKNEILIEGILESLMVKNES